MVDGNLLMALDALQPAHFDALIWLLLALGIPWALWRLRQDAQRTGEEERDARYSPDS